MIAQRRQKKAQSAEESVWKTSPGVGDVEESRNAASCDQGAEQESTAANDPVQNAMATQQDKGIDEYLEGACF